MNASRVEPKTQNKSTNYGTIIKYSLAQNIISFKNLCAWSFQMAFRFWHRIPTLN